MAILFHEDQVNSGLKNKQAIKKWMESVLEKEKKKTGIINFVLTTDENLRKINAEFLSRDYYTDVIAFDYSEGTTVNGDVFISLERVRENAAKYRENETKELMRVMIHGLLHLTGHKDKTGDEKKAMRSSEDGYLKQYFQRD